MSETKKRVFKVTRPDIGGSWCVYRTFDAIDDAEITDSEIGDKLTIEVIEMTDKELDNLPEFQGW